MHLLLAGVFAFFGLHTTLWFSKEVRQRRERRVPPRPPKGRGARGSAARKEDADGDAL
jgi:hypothetical protein